MTLLDFAIQNIARATVLLTVGILAGWALRRCSSSLRHFSWAAVFAALLLLPLVTAVAPHWAWRTAPAPIPAAASTATVTVREVTAVIPNVPAPAPRVPAWWPLLLWPAGFAITAVHFLMGVRRTAAMVRGAIAWRSDESTPVVLSAAAPMPLVWGLARPVIVLPADARGWPAERLRTVLLHERMHIRRRDLLAQAIAHAACCLYWFHPLAWYAARRLREERERACDDAVLRSGIPAPDYATHLVEVVRAVSARQPKWAGAAGMAERSELESRVRDLLDRGRSRRPLSRRAAAAIAAGAFAVLIPLATVVSYAQSGAAVSGEVRDPSGTPVRKCGVVIARRDGVKVADVRCDDAGHFMFEALQPGSYNVQVAAPGFKLLTMRANVAAGSSTSVNANLEVGSIHQRVTVSANAPAAPGTASVTMIPPPRPNEPGVQAARLIKQTRPQYPEDAKKEGVEGTVHLQAVISKTGELLHVEPISPGVDARLVKAAIDAASQWRYEPTLLNGHPVEVLTTIEVQFHR